MLGTFNERTEYKIRKSVIPIETPKTVRGWLIFLSIYFCREYLDIFKIFEFVEVTSFRTGLRKRKREEACEKVEPQISEEWIDESKLELWEIRFFGEKLVVLL